MNKIINYLLNRVFGVAKRYSAVLSAGDSKFLPNFAIYVNKKSAKQNHKVIIGSQCLLGVVINLETEAAKVSMGDNVYMGNSTIISKTSVTFGNNIMVAWGVTFYDHDSHSLDFRNRVQDIRQTYLDYVNEKGNYLKNKNWDFVNSQPIVICDYAWIGSEALILKGVTIGEGAVVGARSVVTKDVPPYTVVAGNPARVIRVLDASN